MSAHTAPSTYFQLAEDVYASNGSDGWVLTGPFDEQGARLTHPWRYWSGQRIEVTDMADQVEPPSFRIAQPPGTPLDFNISGLTLLRHVPSEASTRASEEE